MKQIEQTLTSLEVAEMVGRRHDQVLRDIHTAISHFEGDHKNVGTYFIIDTYKDVQGKERPAFKLTKKGCELYSTRMTGSKGTQFAIAYIERFNQMEEHIQNNQIDTSRLSPELQMFNQLFTAIADTQINQQEQNKRLDRIEAEQKRSYEIFSLDAGNDWKDKVNAILNRIAMRLGGGDQYRAIRTKSYDILEKRARCRLNVRLENAKKDAYARGVLSPTKIKNISKLDVIANDTRLTEIYITIVKELAIAHEVSHEGLSA